MKKSILVLAAVIMSAVVLGQTVKQPDQTNKEYKNVLAIDANGLLKQFFNFGQNPYFTSPYIIGYKRIFKSNALRIGIGGNISTGKSEFNDTSKNDNKRYNFNIGAGYERYSYISKRWNLYYGADAIFTYEYYDYHSNYSTTTSNKEITKQFGYGVSPFLGIQFRINSRLSISTETSYDIIYACGVSKRTYTPPSDYDYTSKSSSIQTQFHAPTSIVFRINI
jgi:hypothetical protein